MFFTLVLWVGIDPDHKQIDGLSYSLKKIDGLNLGAEPGQNRLDLVVLQAYFVGSARPLILSGRVGASPKAFPACPSLS